MQRLNLPDHGVKTMHAPEGDRVFDPIRRKWVALTPEEWVRQHFLNHLVHDLGWPASRIAVERTLTLNGLTKRADAVAYGADGAPLLLLECKAPHVVLDQRTAEQAARYNLVFRVPYLVITNGLIHRCWVIDHATGSIRPLAGPPGPDGPGP